VAETALTACWELVVLVDEYGNRHCGEGVRPSRGHSFALAFSCYLFDGDGRVLLTRRALQKRTWPGVWTNSFCGHPSPGERTVDAVHRRGRQELGLRIDEAVCVLPDFRYRAVAADGTGENEICPVFCARADDSV
jgi:isopentenyl-diphosphate Delta-isomerase